MKRNISIILLLVACSDDQDDTTTTSVDPSITTATSDESSSGESSESSTTDEPDDSSSSDESSESDSGSSSDTGVWSCPDPSTLGMYEACGTGCDAQCGAGLVCRGNYAGGYLAECTAECTSDDECGAGVCSAGYCVQPCGPAQECPVGTFCYPPLDSMGNPIENPAHPLPHCMPQRVE